MKYGAKNIVSVSPAPPSWRVLYAETANKDKLAWCQQVVAWGIKVEDYYSANPLEDADGEDSYADTSVVPIVVVDQTHLDEAEGFVAFAEPGGQDPEKSAGWLVHLDSLSFSQVTSDV